MKLIILGALVLFAVAHISLAARRKSAGADVAAGIIETEYLRFELSPQSGAWSLLDKRSGVVWQSNAYTPRFGQITIGAATKTKEPVDLGPCLVATRGQELVVLFHPVESARTNWLRVTISPRDEGESLDFTCEAAPGLSIGTIRLLDDALWVTDADNGYVLIPSREGILAPSDSGKAYQVGFDTFQYQGCDMRMWGVVKGGSAALVTWDHPDVIAEIHSKLPAKHPTGAKQIVSSSLVLGRSARSFRLRVLGKGDYHTVCRAYRRVAAEKRHVVTWDEKLRECPDRAKLFGAVNFKLWSCLSRRMNEDSTGEQRIRLNWTFDEAAAVAEHLRGDLKLERVLFSVGGWIHRGYDNQHPDILPAAPECGGSAALARCAKKVMGLGYLFCLHDNYQDIYKDSPSWDPSVIVKRKNGTPAKGGRWAGGQAFLINSQCGLEFARRPGNLPAVRKLTGANAYFIDTTTAAGLLEDFDANHPQSRLDDMKWKKALCAYAREEFGVFGSECGKEWGVPVCDFFEGIVGVRDTYFHSWDGYPQRHEAVAGVPLPIFEMVYRDCIAAYGKYGFDPRTSAEYMLWCLSVGRPVNFHSVPPHLYWERKEEKDRFDESPPVEAGRPDPALFTRAHDGWAEGLHVLDRTVKNTAEIQGALHELTAECLLTRYEFLTPDRKVRRSVFGEGDEAVEVVVNMSDRDFACQMSLGGKVRLPPFGFCVEGPTFAAFCATRWGGRSYERPAMFTVRSTSGKRLTGATAARVYHAFGDDTIVISGKELNIPREAAAKTR